MYPRLCKPLLSRSFFLFGARATGKSSLLREVFQSSEFRPEDILWVNLLDPETYRILLLRPETLLEWVNGSQKNPKWVICDEIQKVPALLDVVHHLIEGKKIRFALTGSSARKLKRGGANLLAGRALINELYPLTSVETGEDFKLLDALRWGTLPEVVTADSDSLRREILRAYVGMYLREEIKEEQIVRNLDPFVRFLEVSAQCNGEITNAAKIGRDSRTDAKTILRYFEILQDTLMGFFLDPYQRSIRKVQTEKSKFYWFDLGVRRALEGTLDNSVIEGSSEFGRAFEHFLIAEIFRISKYQRREEKLFYLRTKDNVEIDLIIERSRKELWAIEIKSSKSVSLDRMGPTSALAQDLGARRLIVASREDRPRRVGKVEVLPWRMLLQELYGV
jgi:predicted AAA+ superfamily ATPase